MKKQKVSSKRIQSIYNWMRSTVVNMDSKTNMIAKQDEDIDQRTQSEPSHYAASTRAKPNTKYDLQTLMVKACYTSQLRYQYQK